VQSGQPRRSGEQEPAWARIDICLVLDSEEQVGGPLHFVDDQQAVVPDEQAGIGLCRCPDRGLVEIAQLGSREPGRGYPCERALAGLACPVEDHDTRVGQGSGHAALSVPREQVLCGRH
jgi:hypothetical protein